MKVIFLTTKLFLLASIFFTISMAASTMSPRRYNLSDRLSAQNVTMATIGCQCIMSSPTKQNTDSTLCMCYNRKDGNINETTKCRALTDGVFTFCTDVTDTTPLWQTCVKHYCPCDGITVKPPTNQVNF